MKEEISFFANEPGKCGLEVFVRTKTEPLMKKMAFHEGLKNNLYTSLKETVIDILQEKYLSSDAEYVSADQIADNQHKFYIVDQTDEYKPFAFLDSEPGKFSQKDIADATAIIFKLEREGKSLWLYQQLWSMMIPNKSKKGLMARITRIETGDYFEEMSDPLITIAKKVDLLVIDEHIIITDPSILQRFFGFHDYIRIRADRTISNVVATGIVSNIDKLSEYCNRGHGKVTYAKKLMRIADSEVLRMPKDLLMEKIHESSRWNGKIPEEDGRFVLKTYGDVEALIDLLDERYTRSDITGTEYDTGVKKEAE